MKEPCEGAPAANDTGGAYIYIYMGGIQWEGGENKKGKKDSTPLISLI